MVFGTTKQPKKGSAHLKAVDIAKNLTTQPPLLPEKMEIHAKPTQLALVWRGMLADAHPDMGTITELKGKEMGQLKQIHKHLGENFYQTIYEVVGDWIQFGLYAEKNFGAWKAPLFPTLSYLLMNIQAASSWFADQHQAIAKPDTKVDNQVTSMTPIVKPNHEEEKEIPMTLEELLKSEANE